MNFFNKSEGLMSKIYTENDDENIWTFNLIIYDGYAIDSRFAQVQLNIAKNETTFDQTSGYTNFIVSHFHFQSK